MSMEAMGGRDVPKPKDDKKLSKSMIKQNLQVMQKISTDAHGGAAIVIGKALGYLEGHSQEDVSLTPKSWFSEFDKILDGGEQAKLNDLYRLLPDMFADTKFVMEQFDQKTRYSLQKEDDKQLRVRIQNAFMTREFFHAIHTARSVVWYNRRLENILSKEDMKDFKLIQKGEAFKRFVPMSDETALKIYSENEKRDRLALEDKEEKDRLALENKEKRDRLALERKRRKWA